MDVLFLGVGPQSAGSLRKHLGAQATSRIRFYCHPLEADVPPKKRHWDVIIIGRKVRSHPRVADSVRKNSLRGLKIVLAGKENLRPTIEFWGTAVYSYLLTPINRELLHLVWQNAVGRVELSRKVSRLSQQRKKQRAGVQEQQEVLKSLFVTHLKLQELNQEKLNFLARTSHELLTPLTALQGYLQLLAGGKAGEVNELQSRILHSSLDSCGRLLRLSKSLTDLAALDRNTSNLQLASGTIQDCLQRSVSELEGQIKAKSLTLTVQADEEIPPFRFDFDRMQQVFINLVENAVKFTPEGGNIRICCAPHFWERRTVREMIRGAEERRGKTFSTGANSIRIAVEDTGIGIAPEFLQDIFEDYSRVTNENGMPRGFGLGLAVVRRIVMAHQGKIWAESQPGRGSCFTVLIPITV